jgi:hypothetical protein
VIAFNRIQIQREIPVRRVRCFTASISYQDKGGAKREETLPVMAPDYPSATSLAFAYALLVLNLQDFELRMVGA